MIIMFFHVFPPVFSIFSLERKSDATKEGKRCNPIARSYL